MVPLGAAEGSDSMRSNRIPSPGLRPSVYAEASPPAERPAGILNFGFLILDVLSSANVLFAEF